LLTLRDTRTPPLLNEIYEQITNKTATYHNFIWCRCAPSEGQTPTYTAVGTPIPHLEVQYREREELINSLTQHKLELEQEKKLRLSSQQIYTSLTVTQKAIRRQLDASHTREWKLKADLRAAEKERKKLKDLIATLEASDAVLRADLADTEDEIRQAAIIFDQQSKIAAEKDHVIRTIKKDLFAVRAGLQDAEKKITRLDAELESERKLRIQMTKELDEHAKSRRLYEAEMRLIVKKTEDVQAQLDLLDNLLSRSPARTQSQLDDAYTPRLADYDIVISPDDTGQPPPPHLGSAIPDLWTPPLAPIAKPHPRSPKSLRQTPELNPLDPAARNSSDHPRQISAWLGRVSDSANSWCAGVEGLLETISRLEAERAREAKSRERLKEELAATKDELGVTQGELASTMEELVVTQEELAATMEELGVTQEERAATKAELGVTQDDLTATKERLGVTQKEVSKANDELDRERETLKDTRVHAENVTRELEACKAKLKDAQDARRASIEKFCNAVDLLRQRGADLEALRAAAAASKSKHSKVVSLSAVLRHRVQILEAEVKSLSLNPKSEEPPPTRADSPLFYLPDKGLYAVSDYVASYADTFYTRSSSHRAHRRVFFPRFAAAVTVITTQQ
jgi:chromosome segregation ATPase